MDLKKDLKLSNLRPRKAKDGEAKAVKPKRATKSKAAAKPREIVGLKLGASQIAAARVANNGSAHLHQLARQPLSSGVVVDGEVRDVPALAAALDEFFTTNELP